ncbi:tRNA (N6-threonylcarbamoyladenosine(37)-N6)-methyltransferase TrmO [Vulcanisaeta thermophila]|uniref:tRNA (N6-threonylcarbamoyladenosine(37)-N6)-methyltransferase TrmO n=1 Tax=Vulcanisaeta thermophila TaxID=867917 RepID=UPI000852EBDF|nr:tRNA (N6-threonylcarbamoyladenosine(37)-N6)-methyltransferase TrmO [Vulcanisaeta thermophila]
MGIRVDGFNVVLRPIGVVRHGFDDDFVRRSFNGVDGVVEVFEEFAEGLDGLDGFSHIILISLLHKVSEGQRRVLRVRPRRLVTLGVPEDELPTVGVFATDSPHRPNPIGISVVRLLGRDGRFLRVSGLDLFDGTPILDIKPLTHDKAPHIISFPSWYERLRVRVGDKPI